MSLDTGSDPVLDFLDLKDAVDTAPLTVSPDLSLMEAIVSRSQPSLRCDLENFSSMEGLALPKQQATSCILVMEGQTLLGIVTERDIVRLTAAGLDFRTTAIAEVMVHPVITFPQRSLQDVFAALFLFRRYRIRHLPVVDDQNHLVGVISQDSLRQVMRPANLLRFHRVADVMTTPVIQAPLKATVLEVAQQMAENRVSCVVITQNNIEGDPQPIGIVTERDILQFQVLQLDLAKTKVRDVMSSPLFLLSPNDSLWTAYQAMGKRRVGRLVVSWNWGKGLGIVTQTSLLRVFDPVEMFSIIEALEQTIQQLQGEQGRSLSQPVLGDLGSFKTDSLKTNSLKTDIEQSCWLIRGLLADPGFSLTQRRSQLLQILATLQRLTFLAERG